MSIIQRIKNDREIQGSLQHKHQIITPLLGKVVWGVLFCIWWNIKDILQKSGKTLTAEHTVLTYKVRM